MAEQLGVSIDQIPWEAFSPDTILAFLQYLETKRLNTARSRNARLAAIRAFVRFAIGYASPDFASDAQRILAIPCKRINKPVLGFFNLDELELFLAAADRSTWAADATICFSRSSITPEQGFRRRFNSLPPTSNIAWCACTARDARNATFLSGLKHSGRFRSGAMKTKSVPPNRSSQIVMVNHFHAVAQHGVSHLRFARPGRSALPLAGPTFHRIL